MDISMSSPTSPGSILGAAEEELLQNYFLLISQFGFDKAKELMERERDVHKASFGSSWALMVHALIQLASTEKGYMALGFLEQKWFARAKYTLRTSYQVLMTELRRVEDGVRQQEQLGFGLPGPTMEFEKLMAHLCGQLAEFLRARMKTMDFYEQISTMGSNKNMNYEDLVAVVTDIIQSHSKSFHHPIISSLKAAFTAECDVINHLLNAQLHMSEWQFLPSLLQLHQAHSKLLSWGAASQARELSDASNEMTKKSMFGTSSKTVSLWPALYQWLLRYKCLLVAKFSLYFYDILAKQTTPAEMKALSCKNTEDFVAKLIAFQRRSDAAHVSLVLDTEGAEQPYKGAGYIHPDRQMEAPRGLDSYPAIFSYPGEYPVNHWPNVVMVINDKNAQEQLVQEKVHCFYDKGVQSTYFITRCDHRISIVIIYETKKSEKDSYVNNFLTELSSMLRCMKLLTSLRPGMKVGSSRK